MPTSLQLIRLQLRLLALVSTTLAFRAAWRLFTTPRRLPVKQWEAAAVAGARRFELPFGSGALVAYEWTAPSQSAAPPTILLVHGWEHRASFWGALAQSLRKAGYRVVAFDGPAHGASAGRRTTLPEFGTAIQLVADTVGPVWGVVAHSFGAAATAGLPVRFNTEHAQQHQAGQPTLPRLVLLSVPGSTPAVFQRFAGLLRLPPKVTTRMLRHVETQGGRQVESFSLTQAGPKDWAGRVLLLHDRADETIPFSEAQDVARSWPGLDFRPTNGLGHNRIMRDPAVLRQIAAFLE
ncbi:alpha/beta hydrolase [Hymenobacter elongatus]|uniref:alpha/beta hydrolase n=1 Tax=Hymenobacter elongatus TaxID=877208 RepID=UPI0014369D0F|nr:alpha/beta fold hydrolase [Hymenobacter elongatus]